MHASERLLAVACLLLAIPVTLLKLPWLPGTILAFISNLRELEVSGSASYLDDRNSRLLRYGLALVLYILGSVSIAGLIRIALGCCHRIGRVILWSLVIVVAISLPLFEKSRLGPETDGFYIASVIHLPLSIAVLAIVALLWPVVSARRTMYEYPGAEPPS